MEWPESPSLRYLIHWTLRREQLCDAALECPHEDGECPKYKLDIAKTSRNGLLLTRAVLLRTAMKAGVVMRWRDIPADEYQALMILEEEVDKLQRETDAAQPRQ